MPSKEIPESTYRLQLHAGFTLADAERIVPYLARLGITHLYTSPILTARPGSTHGYDVIDPARINPELGGEAELRSLSQALRERGMGLIVDTVPNHMGLSGNSWWEDVLLEGRTSRYAPFFDISWDGSPHTHGRVLLPVLGRSYGEALEAGELQLVHEAGTYQLAYFEQRFPVRCESQEPPEFLVKAINADTEKLHALLEEQHYRLASWRTASDEINYRRFFDINELAAINTQQEEVFAATHRLTLQLVQEGVISGLRIDHPDGLYDPRQYFHRLQKQQPLYVVAEKILASEERLPEDWPVDGTSGYDILNQINGLFVDPQSQQTMTRLYQAFTARGESFGELAQGKKLQILDESLASELRMLAETLDDLAQSHRRTRDLTFTSLRNALRHLIACLKVYRTYITAEGFRGADRELLETAAEAAGARLNKADLPALAFLLQTLLLRGPADRALQAAFAGRFQQLSAPATAKGVEDTAFYVYNRLVSLNEVGGDPEVFGHPPEQLHAFLRERQQRWPCALTPLSTHDTKRSEDVRARINVLSEMPDEWRLRLATWQNLNAPLLPIVDSRPAPSANDQYLLYQTFLGAWPLGPSDDFPDRMVAYMIKAIREGKENSSWVDPNGPYERGVEQFIRAILAPDSKSFLHDFLPFQQRIAWFGMLNALSQTVLKCTAPGVPDTYQGCELFNLSLVDPDNRRPVDYPLREKLLEEFWRPDLSSWGSGAVKLHLLRALLQERRKRPGLFSFGSYQPLRVRGPAADHVFAFLREHRGTLALVIVTRLLARLTGGQQVPPLAERFWSDTFLDLPEPCELSDLFTGARSPITRETPLARLLEHLHVAVLVT